MNSNWTEIGLAVILAGAAISMVIWFLKYKTSSSEWRMFNMLQRAGVDPGIIDDGDHNEIMRVIRKRCNQCQAEDVCEHWLAGTYKEDNLFCPNAHVFRALAAKNRPISTIYD